MSSFSTTGEPDRVKPNTAGNAGHQYASIEPTTSQMYAELSENKQIYDESRWEVLTRSTPSFSTTGGPNRVKPNTAGDAGHQYASIDPATSEMYAKLSENERIYDK